MDLSFGPLAIAVNVLSVALAVSCVLLSRRRGRRIERMSVPLLRDLVRELRKLPVSVRVSELHRRAEDGTWEHRLADEMMRASLGPARIAAANDVLFDLEHELELGKSWSFSAVRMALLGTALLGLAAYLSKGGPIALAGALLIGFLGAGASYVAGEQGSSLARARREAFDALVSSLLPEEVAEARAQRARRRDRA